MSFENALVGKKPVSLSSFFLVFEIKAFGFVS